MNRRNFIKTVAAAGAAYSAWDATKSFAASSPSSSPLPERPTGITSYVADFVVQAQYSSLPAEVIELGKKSILDGIGLAVVGARSEGSRLLEEYLRSLGCVDGKVRVLGTKNRLPLRFAALASGVSMHMEDFDDTQIPVPGDTNFGQVIHPTTPVLPVALGFGDVQPVSGKEFMLAYHVGAEVACKIADACSARAYKTGFHATGIFGVFGSAAAYAKLRGFDARRTSHAFALAASQGSGLAENFGTLTKSFQAGHAAEAGVVAVDLAAIGWDGAANILEAPNGFFHAYGETFKADYLLNKLGHPWSFSSPGVAIKPYPSGAVSHPAMTELARLIQVEGIKAADVVQVEVGTSAHLPKYLHYHQPQKGLEGKFSMEFCLAALLVVGRAGLGEFTDAVVSRPDIQEMMGRVRFYVDPEIEASGQSRNATKLKVHLKNGRTIESKVEFGKGSPANPMSYDEVAEKFRGCMDYAGWSTARSNQIVELVRHLEDLPSVAAITELGVG
ncbi:MAG: MmgE/PrpD family protein [Verrucomicrobia bacterium]|nr:MmgE/PrpD family protein [Verrucomicrobiota bacterium]